jgi:simple sugar transport system substrate-binding protein
MKRLGLLLAGLLLAACANDAEVLNIQTEDKQPEPVALGKVIQIITQPNQDERTALAIEAAADQAAERFGYEIQISVPTSSADALKQLRNSTDVPDLGGVIVASDGAKMGKALSKVSQTGIPVVGIGDNSAAALPFGALGFVGVTDVGIGDAVGSRFKVANKSKLLCITSTSALKSREVALCRSIGEKLKSSVVVSVKVSASGAPENIRKAIAGDKEIDSVLLANPKLMSVFQQAQENIVRDLTIGVLGYSDKLESDLRNGNILFMTDNQEAMQVRYAVDMLGTFLTTAGRIGNGNPVLTGPDIVTAATIDAVVLARKDLLR